ncbi:hypothetical protein OSB04_001920 [Centaurea solstitialis]|uniref:Uncharacterized protein n=1 Tax=Centaurea solstitialis TaxID=347529 RepID=A0AA38WUN2_9ASTR|nr:hypothetical protein OSB04_001920 [Centaurea solstitialis]
MDEVVTNVWRQEALRLSFSTPIHKLCSLLKLTKVRLKEWHAQRLHDRRKEIDLLKQKLAALNCLADFVGLSSEDCLERGTILETIEQIDSLEVADPKQRAKLKWVTDGDENTVFFHGVINGRRRANRLHGLAANGTWIKNPNCLKNMAFDYF